MKERVILGWQAFMAGRRGQSVEPWTPIVLMCFTAVVAALAIVATKYDVRVFDIIRERPLLILAVIPMITALAVFAVVSVMVTSNAIDHVRDFVNTRLSWLGAFRWVPAGPLYAVTLIASLVISAAAGALGGIIGPFVLPVVLWQEIRVG